ncbi:MAG TPA: hypothetical protein VIQ30_13490 [Pseudonocardia sp.]
MLALVGAVFFLIAAIVLLVHDPIQLNDLLKVLGFILLAVQLSGVWRYGVRQFEALGLVAALLFLIALILEFTRYPAVTDTILTTIGFIFVALFMAGVGPRTTRRL